MFGIFDRKKKFKSNIGIFLLLAAFAASAEAQVIGKTMSAGALPACNSDKNFGLVTDATNATTLGSGGGNAAVWVRCISGVWTIDEVAAVADLSAYAELAPAAALEFEPGTDFTVTPTAGSFVLNAVGAGEDGSLIVVDDLIATGTDFLPTFSATAVITAPVTDITASTSSTITTATLTAAVTTAVIDAGGSTDELTVAAGSVRAGVALGIPSLASLPTCDSTIAPAGTTALIWDTTGPDLCACPEGVDWVAIDGSGTCA
jgi:hypothetical protein